MTRILFCVVPEKGHLNPCIGPAQHLRAAGHEVAFYAPADIGDQLAHAGDFVFLGPSDRPERHDLSRGASFASNVKNANWLAAWIRGLLIDGTPPLVPPIRAAMRDWRPDVVVVDPLLYAAAIAAQLEKLTWVSLSNSLNPVLPDSLDSDLLRTVRDLAPARHDMFAAFGLTAMFRGCDVISPFLTIAFTTEALVGTPPPGVKVVGPAWPADDRGDETSFPWEQLDDDLPVVYMSMGSQLYYQPDIFNKAIRALRHLPVQLVLSVGELAGSDLLDITRVAGTDNRVIAMRYVPQLAMLRRAQVFITHCGANSIMEALACGTPMLLSPVCNDQFHSAYFVEQSGAGCRIDLAQASETEIAHAVQRALGPGRLREQASRLAASYQRDGSAEAAKLISEIALRVGLERTGSTRAQLR